MWLSPAPLSKTISWRLLWMLPNAKKAETELQKLLKELERSNNELRQFAYVASHDLQEPLRAIAGFLQLLQTRYRGQLDEKGRHYIERSVNAARRMQTLISSLFVPVQNQHHLVGSRKQ